MSARPPTARRRFAAFSFLKPVPLGLIGAVLILLAAAPGARAAERVTLTLLHFNDMAEISPSNHGAKVAELATLLNRERVKAAYSVTTFGGDLLSPSLLSPDTQGSHMIDLLNALRVDYAVPGNHEFDFGPEVAEQRFKESDFSWLAANLRGPDDAQFPGTVGVAVRQVGPFSVGFLGLIMPETKILAQPGESTGFEPPIAAAQRAVAQLKTRKVDAIVALTHLDLADDQDLARAVPDIDLILGGHDLETVQAEVGRTLIFKTGSDAKRLAAVDLTLDGKPGRGGRGVSITAEWRLSSSDLAEPDKAVAARVAGYERQLRKALDQPVGVTETALVSRRVVVREAESTFGNLVTDALRARTGADIGLMNSGGIRGNTVYPAGTELTRKDILAELPFGNVAVVVRISGLTLREALEHAVSQVNQDSGRFLQVSGVHFVYDPSRPVGRRVTEAKVHGEPLDPGALYTVATIDYLLDGGDGYDMLARGDVLLTAEGGPLLVTLVMDMLVERQTVAPRVEGRIVARVQ